jgi:hypothetical protein
MSYLTNPLLVSLQSIHLPYLTLSHYRDSDYSDAEHLWLAARFTANLCFITLNLPF